MTRVTLNDGSMVIFGTPGGGDFETQGLGSEKVKAKLLDVTQRAGRVLLEAITGVRDSLGAMAPAELEIELGISLSEEGSIIVSSAKAEASLTIKATWKASGEKS